MNDLLYHVDVWPNREDDGLILRLNDILIRENHLLLDLARIWEVANNEGKHFEDALIHIKRLVAGPLVKVLYKLLLIVLPEQTKIDFVHWVRLHI